MAKAAEQSVLDDIADEAVGVPDEYPPGTPEFKPFLRLRPLSLRAQFKRKFAEFTKMQEPVTEAREAGLLTDDENTEVSSERMAKKLEIWAHVDDMFAAMDDLMRMAAIDTAAYDAWSEELEDDEVRALVFNIYMKKSQLGEASSSAS